MVASSTLTEPPVSSLHCDRRWEVSRPYPHSRLLRPSTLRDRIHHPATCESVCLGGQQQQQQQKKNHPPLSNPIFGEICFRDGPNENKASSSPVFYRFPFPSGLQSKLIREHSQLWGGRDEVCGVVKFNYTSFHSPPPLSLFTLLSQRFPILNLSLRAGREGKKEPWPFFTPILKTQIYEIWATSRST